MKKTKTVFNLITLIAFVCVVLFFVGNLSKIKPRVALANEYKTYSTNASISTQGENGFYYAWGTVDKYALMTYGAANGGGYSWRALESYATINGRAMHPGQLWGSLIVWVANESGTVSLVGFMEKSTTFGDGVNIGVYHQKNAGDKVALLSQTISNNGVMKYSLETTLEIVKGDTIVFYCDSGLAKENSSDSVDCLFDIKYVQQGGDGGQGEDTLKYLNLATPTEIADTKHIEQGNKSEILDGTLTQKTTYGCASTIAFSWCAPIALISLFVIRRKQK